MKYMYGQKNKTRESERKRVSSGVNTSRVFLSGRELVLLSCFSLLGESLKELYIYVCVCVDIASIQSHELANCNHLNEFSIRAIGTNLFF